MDSVVINYKLLPTIFDGISLTTPEKKEENMYRICHIN